MKLHIAHTFPCDVETYWRAFEDPDLDASLVRASRMSRELLSEEVGDDGVIVRVQRFVAEAELPPAAANLVGQKRLSYDQTSRIDRARGVITWEVVPPVFKDKVTARGTYTVRPHPEGCERVLDGEVVVRVAVFGKKIEQLVADVLGKAYANGSVLIRRWIEEHPNG